MKIVNFFQCCQFAEEVKTFGSHLGLLLVDDKEDVAGREERQTKEGQESKVKCFRWCNGSRFLQDDKYKQGMHKTVIMNGTIFIFILFCNENELL